MNWTTIITLIANLVSLVPSILKAWDISPAKGVEGVTRVVENTPIAADLANLGAALFPKLSPTLHAAAAALVIAHPNNTSWVQSALNVLASTGYITLTTRLAVDGVYGPKTKAAVELVQAKLQFAVNGFVGDVEYNAIAALLSKV